MNAPPTIDVLPISLPQLTRTIGLTCPQWLKLNRQELERFYAETAQYASPEETYSQYALAKYNAQLLIDEMDEMEEEARQWDTDEIEEDDYEAFTGDDA